METSIAAATAHAAEKIDSFMLDNLSDRIRQAESIAGIEYWEYDYSSKLLYMSDGILKEFLGIKQPAGNRMPISEFIEMIVSDDRDDIRSAVRTLSNGQDGGTGKKVSYRLISADGKTKHILNHIIKRDVDRDGNIIICGYAQDITGTLENMQELESLRIAMDCSDQEIFAFTVDGKLFYANRLSRERYKFDKKGGAYSIEHVNPYYNTGNFKELADRIDANGGLLHIDTEHLLPDGRKLPVSVKLHKAVSYSGVPLVWGQAADISKGVEQQRKINELSRIMETILEYSPLYMYIKDGLTQRYLYWSRSMEQLTGVTKAKVRDMTEFEIYPELNDAEKIQQIDQAILVKGGSMEYLDVYTMRDGVKHTLKTIKTVIRERDANPMIVAVAIDMTDMKTAEQELIKARLKSEKSNKLKNSILGKFSHDVKGLITDVAKLAQLEAREAERAERDKYMITIERNINNLLGEAGEVTDILEIETGKMTPENMTVDVGELCRQTVERLRGGMSKNIALSIDPSSERLKVISDGKRIGQVLSRIIAASSKYIASGAINISYRYTEGKLRFRISDNGTGLANEALGLVLNQYASRDGNRNESDDALGMVLCKMIVEHMGGNFEVTSAKGVGSQFIFDFACSRAEAGAETPAQETQSGAETAADKPAESAGATAAPAVADNAAKGPKRVLVAEDVDSNYQLLQALIGRIYSLSRAHNGQEAVDMFSQMNPEPDIILMDMKMPVMDGLEATREIRKISSSIPIVALTAHAFNDNKVEALSAGCNDFLTKPIAADILKKTIEKYTAK